MEGFADMLCSADRELFLQMLNEILNDEIVHDEIVLSMISSTC